MQQLLYSGVAVRAVFILCRILPVRLSYSLVNIIAYLLAGLSKTAIVQSIGKNQQTVHGRKMSSKDLFKSVRQVVMYAGQGFIDLYHTLDHKQSVFDMIEDNEDLNRLIRMSRGGSRGGLVVVPHMGCFDLMLMAAAAKGMKAKVLTVKNPGGGYRFQNQIRSFHGLEILPVSKDSYEQSIEFMKNGGIVITAVDRSVTDQPYRLNFFGKPRRLPGGYVLMALQADVPVVPGTVYKNIKGRYELTLSDPVDMVPKKTTERTIVHNAEIVLQTIENHIRAHPFQWQMYYPV